VLPRDGTIVPTITHADLASLCGGSRENVTRILTEFQRRNLIEKDNGRFRLKKVSGLARIAEL
jgi:CRP-like cAMP-binding protein